MKTKKLRNMGILAIISMAVLIGASVIPSAMSICPRYGPVADADTDKENYGIDEVVVCTIENFETSEYDIKITSAKILKEGILVWTFPLLGTVLLKPGESLSWDYQLDGVGSGDDGEYKFILIYTYPGQTVYDDNAFTVHPLTTSCPPHRNASP